MYRLHTQVRHRILCHATCAGQDDGCVQVWDTRQAAKRPTQSFSDQGDYTTDMAYNAAKSSLVATSGDGSLAVYDVRKAGRLKALSESDEDERMSVAIAKGGSKVVSGTQAGVLELWSWGHFADCSDRCAAQRDCTDKCMA